MGESYNAMGLGASCTSGRMVQSGSSNRAVPRCRRRQAQPRRRERWSRRLSAKIAGLAPGMTQPLLRGSSGASQTSSTSLDSTSKLLSRVRLATTQLRKTRNRFVHVRPIDFSGPQRRAIPPNHPNTVDSRRLTPVAMINHGSPLAQASGSRLGNWRSRRQLLRQ